VEVEDDVEVRSVRPCTLLMAAGFFATLHRGASPTRDPRRQRSLTPVCAWKMRLVIFLEIIHPLIQDNLSAACGPCVPVLNLSHSHPGRYQSSHGEKKLKFPFFP